MEESVISAPLHLHIRRVSASPLTTQHSPLTTHYAPIWSLWRHRALIRQFARREFRTRYLGSFLGVMWSVVTPALMLCIYTFVFRGVYQVHWDMLPDGSVLAFAVNLFGGLLVYSLFVETAGRSPHLVAQHPQFVKKVVFPLEILPVATTLAALGHALISFTVVSLVAAVFIQLPSWHVAWLPLLLLPYVCFLLGVSWLFAAVGAFWRDLAPAVTVGLQALIFLTPVFYPLQAVPASWQTILRFNPLAIYVENTRRVWLWNQPPDFGPWALTTVASLIIMQAGYWWFMRSKRAFADVV